MEVPTKKTVNDSKALTTFVEADTETFKDVVQRLTGSSEAAAHEVTTAKGNIGVKKPEFKLHERRQYKAKLEIIKPPLSIKQGAAVMQQYYQEQQLQSSLEQQKFSPSSSGNKIRQTSPMTTPTKCFSSLSLGESRGEPAASDQGHGYPMDHMHRQIDPLNFTATNHITMRLHMADICGLQLIIVFTHHPHKLFSHCSQCHMHTSA